MDLGLNEILLVLVVALLVYGDRLPEVARSLGRTLASLKRSLSDSAAAVTREVESVRTDTDDALDEVRPRTVRRVPRPAPEELAKEDITAPPPEQPDGPRPSAPGPQAD